MLTLGFDTSNYATSLAVFDTDAKEVVCAKKKFLPVKEGQRGLRQSEALFHHTAALPGLRKHLAGELGERLVHRRMQLVEMPLADSRDTRDDVGTERTLWVCRAGVCQHLARAQVVKPCDERRRPHVEREAEPLCVRAPRAIAVRAAQAHFHVTRAAFRRAQERHLHAFLGRRLAGKRVFFRPVCMAKMDTAFPAGTRSSTRRGDVDAGVSQCRENRLSIGKKRV